MNQVLVERNKYKTLDAVNPFLIFEISSSKTAYLKENFRLKKLGSVLMMPFLVEIYSLKKNSIQREDIKISKYIIPATDEFHFLGKMYFLHNGRWKTDLYLQIQLPPIHEHRHISYNPGQNILAVKTSAKADIKVLFSGLVYI